VSAGRVRLVVAVHLFLVRGGRVLLLRRANTGYEDGNFGVVAGHVERGEEVRAAAIREAREEVGVSLAPADVVVVGVMHRRAEEERIDFFLEVRRWQGEPRNCEPDKCSEVAWFALDDLPSNVIPYVRRSLENYRSGTWYDAFGWDDALADGGTREKEGAC
jgi:8-oxo-dGTP diphosphatase